MCKEKYKFIFDLRYNKSEIEFMKINRITLDIETMFTTLWILIAKFRELRTYHFYHHSPISSTLVSELKPLVSLNKEVKVESSAFPLNRRCLSSMSHLPMSQLRCMSKSPLQQWWLNCSFGKDLAQEVDSRQNWYFGQWGSKGDSFLT